MESRRTVRFRVSVGSVVVVLDHRDSLAARETRVPKEGARDAIA